MPAPLPSPVIFLPGIMGSTLRDEYQVDPDNVWSVAKAALKSYERITLHPDDLRYEMKEPARVVKDQVFELFYNEIIQELRYNLSPGPEIEVPVFPFAYDWRQPLAVTEAALAAFVNEVIERTSLLRHYNAEGYKPKNGRVNLVGHSMGGLVIAGYVQKYGLAQVDKVVTLASPFRGSIEAITKTTLGGGGFSSSSGGSREREAARLTPALYHLLPSYDGAVKPVKRDVYLKENWQRGIVRTIGGFIDRNSLLPKETDPQKRADETYALAETLLTRILDDAWDHRSRIEKLRLPDPKRWLSVVGVGGKTRVDVKITVDPTEGPFFDIPDEVNDWKAAKPSVRTGDNTVPYHGARCAFIPTEQVVCLSTDDFGFWEFGDKLLTHLGFHSALPSMNVAIRLTISHLRGKPQGDIWGRPSPEIKAKDWDPPIPGLARK